MAPPNSSQMAPYTAKSATDTATNIHSSPENGLLQQPVRANPAVSESREIPLGEFSDLCCWLGWGPAWMTRAYSEYLRIRVVRDVEAGCSRRSVAFKYAVSISFMIKLVQRLAVGGHDGAARDRWPQGPCAGGVYRAGGPVAGEQARHHAGRIAAWLDWRRGVDRTLIDRPLSQGARADVQKRRRTPPSRSVPTSPPVPPGASSSLI